MKSVKIGNQEAMVQTLIEWLNQRMAQLRYLKRTSRFFSEIDAAEIQGRLIEIGIIREKVLDGRIQEIGIDKKFDTSEVE